MLAGREGNGTTACFLGRARNSQGGTFDPSPCSVCVSLNLSLLLSRLPFPHPPLPPACLPACLQPSPGESITKQVDALVSATSHGGCSLR